MQTSPDIAKLPGIVDLSARTKLRFTGADRVRFINGQISNDARRATADQSIYACVMTIKGKMCADVFVHAELDSLLVDAETELRETLSARLERYIIADDVELHDATEEFALWHILPLAGEESAFTESEWLSDLGNVHAVRSKRFGCMGIDLFFPIALQEQFRARLVGKCREINLTELETIRIAAGVPRWGAELDENTMPAEANLEERAVDYSKGCYIGQEVVSRVKSIGHVNRTLCVLLAVDATATLRVGMLLYPISADEPRGKEVGRITSVSPDVGTQPSRHVALGYVRHGSKSLPAMLEAAGVPTSNEGAKNPVASCQVQVCSLPPVLP